MFERFTESSRRAIFFCREEAMQRGAAEISTADLLFGILHDPAEPGSAVVALQARAAELRQLFAATAATGTADPSLPLSTTAKRALSLAAEEANRRHVREVSRDHLLHGILQTNDSTARTLRAAGA